MSSAQSVAKASHFARVGAWARVAMQFGLLVLVSQLAERLVAVAGLPVPSNAVGMLVLFLLLHRGVLRLDHVDAGAGLLTRHLALFFVPIAVGLMAYGDLLARRGAELLWVVGASAVVGIWVAGWVTQAMKRRQS